MAGKDYVLICFLPGARHAFLGSFCLSYTRSKQTNQGCARPFFSQTIFFTLRLRLRPGRLSLKVETETETFGCWYRKLRLRLRLLVVGIKSWDWDWDFSLWSQILRLRLFTLVSKIDTETETSNLWSQSLKPTKSLEKRLKNSANK